MANPILSSMHIAALLLSFLLFFILGMSSAQLSENFYETSCPEALSIIKLSVHSTVQTEPRMGASLLRLHFFDCFINGCDGSILLDDTANFTGEKSADPIRGSIRGYDVIDNIKAQLENSCPDVVSCADILTVVARDSVVELGGPTWKVLLGRRDSTTASLTDANMDIPGPASNLSQLISAFSKKGFSVNEMVALAGAHTIGKARCTNFRNRIYNDTNINAPFARSMQAICPPSGGDNNLASLDSSSTSFDNVYFNNLLSQKGLMHSDQELFNGGSTDSLVRTYSSNPSTFASDFANAMEKMDNLSPLTGSNGQIRKNCRKIN